MVQSYARSFAVMQQTTVSSIPRWRWWVRAMRPATLPLSALPTLIGIAWAKRAGAFDPGTALLTILCAVALQVVANYVNEVGDYRRGADVPAARQGPPRAVAVGAISPQAMVYAAVILSLVVLMMGLVLVFRTGWWLLALGLGVLGLAWLYTSGPRPLAYMGGGEVAAFVLFGIVPCTGAYAVQRAALSVEPIVSGVAFGAFAAAVLGINNLRDRVHDSTCGKRTLAVRWGHARATHLVQWLLSLPYLVLVGLGIAYPVTSAALVSLPLAWSVARDLPLATPPRYNRLLQRTVLTATVYGLVLFAAIVANSL